MRKLFAVALGSAVALMGFAGAANASATIDLVWVDASETDATGAVCMKAANRNCTQLGVTLSTAAVTDNITLLAILTAGGGGVLNLSISVDYGNALPKVSVVGFRRFNTKPYLPGSIGSISDIPPFIDNLNAVAAPFVSSGIGLPAGFTAYVGSVTFHKDQLISGLSEFKVGINGPGMVDGIVRLTDGVDISSTSTFNSAFMFNVPEPGALSMLAMGLGGMLLAGRNRSS
jgi:hypothetical protein